MADLCDICGGDLALIGRTHRCVPRTVAQMAKPPALPLANEPRVANGVDNTLPSYRYRDPEKRRAYMRDYMRRRRASG